MSTDVLNRLIILGCDVNLQDNEKMTPMHYSLELENLLAFKILLQAGADPNIPDDSEETVAECVMEMDKEYHTIFNKYHGQKENNTHIES